MTARAATEALDRFFDGNDDVQVIGRTDGAWDVMVPSYWKESVAVSLSIGDRSLRGEAFFMRAPEEREGHVFKLLLRRNEHAHLWKFAANEEGDVSLVAEIPFSAVNDEALDVLFGALITLVDETYVPYMKLGFATALEEQVRSGGPGLDRPPWAAKWEASPDSPT